MTSFSIRSFGCRVNQAEAFEWAAVFQDRGWRLSEDALGGDIIIVNTCTLTARADRDVRKFIRKAGRERPGARIVVTGCLAERAPGDVAGLPGVWKIFSNRDKSRLPEDLAAGAPAAAAEATPRSRARAFLKVQDGCDGACAFCIIPSVRGRSASVPPDRVLSRVRALVSRSYAEIVLTAIHLSSYGLDLDPRSSLRRLLRAIDEEGGRFRVRLASLDPRLLSDDLLGHLTSSTRVCPQFHLSLQHVTSRMLEAMGRPAPVDAGAMLHRFRASAPDAALGADVIVGFPGETDADFETLTGFIERSPLSYLHVFSYSPRPGTAAAGRRAVDAAVASRRASRLRALSLRLDLAFRRRFLGRILDGVVIRADERGARIFTGNAVDVFAPGYAPQKGRAVRARITAVNERATVGELIE